MWLITPLSWLLFATNLMGYFFLSGWTPTLLTAAKLPPATAAIAAAALQVGGTVGALFVGMPVQQLYMWSALPFAAGAVVCFAIHVLNMKRLKAHPELGTA